jgi:hypothetical protein
MTPLIESRSPERLPEPEEQGACVEDTSGGVWTRESAPEEFLRAVVDTLSGFLREPPASNT